MISPGEAFVSILNIKFLKANYWSQNVVKHFGMTQATFLDQIMLTQWSWYLNIGLLYMQPW